MSSLIDGAKLLLYSHEPLIAAALSMLRVVERPERDMVAETDGKCIYVGKKFYQLDKSEAAFVLAHEVMHVLSQHCNGRLPADLRHLVKGQKIGPEDRAKLDRWARACDIVINERLKRSHNAQRGLLVFPHLGGETATRYAIFGVMEKTEEDVYYELGEQEKQETGCVSGEDGQQFGGMGEKGSGNSPSTPNEGWGEGGHGDVVPGEEALSDRELDEIISLAAVSAGVGDDQYIGRELVEGRLRRPKDWKAELLEALTLPSVGGDVTWSRRNRRTPTDEVILPAVRDWQASLAVVVDLSGSTVEYVPRFLRELRDIISQVPLSRLVVMTHTTTVETVLDVDNQDEAVARLETLRLDRTGGTLYAPVVEELLKMDELTAVVWLTDLMPADWATAAPLLIRLGRPLVWAVPERYARQFGKRGQDYGKVTALVESV